MSNYTLLVALTIKLVVLFAIPAVIMLIAGVIAARASTYTPSSADDLGTVMYGGYYPLRTERDSRAGDTSITIGTDICELAIYRQPNGHHTPNVNGADMDDALIILY